MSWWRRSIAWSKELEQAKQQAGELPHCNPLVGSKMGGYLQVPDGRGRANMAGV